MTATIRAAIYARVSDPKQVAKSGLAVQVQECRKYASELGYEVVDVYQDEGISGAHGVGHRVGLDRMLSDAREGRFDILLVHELDRLARELFVGLGIVGMVAEYRTQLLEVSTRTLFDDHGALMGLVKLWGAGEDRKRILRRTKQGHIERAKNGKVSGPPPLGYDKTQDGGLQINPDESELVRRIFNLYLNEGHHLDSIATLLNAEGVKTKRARLNEAGKNNYRGASRWQRSTIQCVLKNPVYKGVYVYGKTHGRVPAGKEYSPDERRPMLNPKLQTSIKNRTFLPHEQVTVDVPAIVSAEVWERAQLQLQDRASKANIRKGATKYNYRFSGIVRCHYCKRLMTRMTMSMPRKDGSVRETSYYTCRNQENDCPNAHTHHRMGSIDHQIVSRLMPVLENPDALRLGLSAELERKEHEHARLTGRVRTAQEQVVKVEAKKKKLLELYLDEGISGQDYKAKAASLDADLERIRHELATVQRELADLSFEGDKLQVETVIKFFSALVEQVPEPHLRWLWAITLGKPEDIDMTDDYQELSENHEAVSTLVKLAQELVKSVTIDKDSNIVDYVIRVQMPTPPSGSEGGESATNHIANLKCITSPSFTS